MAADYPAAITDLGPGLTGVPLGPEHPQHHTDLRDEIVAIETELGVNPSGSETDVAARLAAIEAAATLAHLGVFHVDSYGAAGDGTTDDSAAFLAARAAAVAAGGGTIQLAAKTYLLDGALVTSEGGNALFALPVDVPLRIRGVQPANNCDPRTDTGYSVIKVTKTGLTRSGTDGVPSVIGGPTDSTWAETMVSLEDFCLWLPKNPTIAGIDLWHVRRFLIDGVSVVAINTGDADYTDPTSVHAFGIRTAEPQNYNACLIRNAQVHGTYAGLVGSTESLTVEYFVAKWCKVGWGPAPGGHGGVALKMSIEWCPYSISGWTETAGATSIPASALGVTDAQVHVSYLAVEDYTGASKWYDPVYHVNDSTNRLKGVAFFDLYSGGIGSSLTVNGASNLTMIPVLAPDFGVGGGSALTVQDENSNVSTSVTQLDFQGAGVTVTSGTGEVIVTIPGGSATRAELVMQDGVTAPPVPLETEARDDWLYTD